jgi:hypothetical protein
MKFNGVFLLMLILSACQSEEDTSELRREVMEADRNFSKMAAQKGVAEAFIFYADEKVIKPSPGQQPLVGKFALIESYKKTHLSLR